MKGYWKKILSVDEKTFKPGDLFKEIYNKEVVLGIILRFIVCESCDDVKLTPCAVKLLSQIGNIAYFNHNGHYMFWKDYSEQPDVVAFVWRNENEAI
jgi:hypothetical protein